MRVTWTWGLGSGHAWESWEAFFSEWRSSSLLNTKSADFAAGGENLRGPNFNDDGPAPGKKNRLKKFKKLENAKRRCRAHRHAHAAPLGEGPQSATRRTMQ